MKLFIIILTVFVSLTVCGQQQNNISINSKNFKTVNTMDVSK